MLSDIGMIVLLLLVNAFFAGSEIALLSVNTTKVRARAEEGDKRAILLKKTIEDPSRFLATIQIGITLASLFAGAYAASAFAGPIVTALMAAGIAIPRNVLEPLIMVLITMALAYFNLVLGELVPKRIAMRKADAIASVIVGIIRVISVAATPFVKLLSVSTNAILRLFGIDPHDNDEEVTEEEIRMMVDVGGNTGMIDEAEQAMINNVFEFDNKTVADIAVHRTDIVALDVNATKDEIVEVALRDRYSRIPVYEDNIDNIIGILHLKDFMNAVLLPAAGTLGRHMNAFDLRAVLRKPFFVPVSKTTDKLFEEMQKSKNHMAIIVDEYGGTEGLVTMEDLIEEIMGSIYDEYDEEDAPDITTVDANTFVLAGTADLDSVAKFFNVTMPVDEYETVSGFIIGQIGRIPADDEQIEITFEDLLFKVNQIEDRRIVSATVVQLA